MRRREGALVPLEAAVLAAGLDLRSAGQPEFHGFLLAKAIRDGDHARGLTAHGTLYKALDRMERMGLLESRWEVPDVAAAAGRPRRRFYRVTSRASVRSNEARDAAMARSTERGLA